MEQNQLTESQIKKREYNKKFREKQKLAREMNEVDSITTEAYISDTQENPIEHSEEPLKEINNVSMSKEQYNEIASYLQQLIDENEKLRQDQKNVLKGESTAVIPPQAQEPSFFDQIAKSAIVTTLNIAIPMVLGLAIQTYASSGSKESETTSTTTQNNQSKQSANLHQPLY